MDPTFDHDIVIIGAGPAGAAAAITLARAGRSPILLEAQRFPREKVCGGCLSGTATLGVQRLLGQSAALPGIATARITFVIGGRRLTCRPEGRTRLVTRPEFDACLAKVAADEGADVRYGHTAKLEFNEQRCDVLYTDERWRARHVLVASGVGRLAQCLGVCACGSKRVLVSQRWVQPTADVLPRLGEVELHWLRGGYVGVATPKPGECAVATAVEACDLGGEPVFERLRRLNPDAAILDGLRPDHGVNGKGTAGFPWRTAALGRENVLLLGDAAGYEEPFTGDGIGQALVSGVSAAQAVLAGGDVLSRYTAMMRRRIGPALMRTRWISRALRSGCIHRLASVPGLRIPFVERLVEYVHVRAAT